MFTFVYIIFFTSNNHTYECTLLFNNRQGSCHFGSEVRKVSYISVDGIRIWDYLFDGDKRIKCIQISFRRNNPIPDLAYLWDTIIDKIQLQQLFWLPDYCLHVLLVGNK